LIFFIVLLNSPHRQTPKKNKEKVGFGLLVIFFGKNFSTRFVLQNVFYSAFELPSLKKKTENAITQKKSRKRTFCQNTCMVFLNSPCRETPKNVQKKVKKKKSDGGRVGLGFSKCAGGSVDYCFGGPGPPVLRVVDICYLVSAIC
jgi:hypothetical protein